MATIDYVEIEYNGRKGKHFQWTLGDDDVGQPVTFVSDEVELTMAWTGTYGGATLTGEGQIGGTVSGTPTNSGFIAADDAYGIILGGTSGNAIRPVGPGIDSFRPQTAGGTSTSLVVTLKVFEKVRP